MGPWNNQGLNKIMAVSLCWPLLCNEVFGECTCLSVSWIEIEDYGTGARAFPETGVMPRSGFFAGILEIKHLKKTWPEKVGTARSKGSVGPCMKKKKVCNYQE